MLKNLLQSKIRLFPQGTWDIFMCTMADLPSAHLISLLTEKLKMNENLITVEKVYHFKKYSSWLNENITHFDDDFFLFFLENYYHSSDYAIKFLEKTLEILKNNNGPQKIIIHSFKISEDEAKKLMELFPAITLIIRTDSEYFFNELYYKKTPIEEIPNILYRKNDGTVEITRSEEVSYDLEEYIVGAYKNGIIFRKEKNTNYIASLFDPDDERTNEKYYYRQPLKKRLAAFDVANRRNQMMITTGRGCKYKCGYCYRGVKYSTIRQIPLNIIKDDLDALSSIGVNRIYIYDDCFLTTNRNRLTEITELFASYPMTYGVSLRYEMCNKETLEILEKMQFHHIQIGLQTISKETNLRVGRGLNEKNFEKVLEVLHKRNITTSIDIILGLPWETLYDFIRTFSYAISLSPKNIVINSLFLNPGTELFKSKDTYGIKTTEWGDYGVPFIIESTTFPKEDIEKARKYVIKSMDLYPNIRFTLR